ncbi:MAG: hypothetical protein U0452_14130 [Anaerolineae bacterium]
MPGSPHVRADSMRSPPRTARAVDAPQQPATLATPAQNPLTPEAVLRLQRTAGNRATTQLVQSRNTQRELVQRAVGFEFEDGNWASFQKVAPKAQDEDAPAPRPRRRFEGRTFALGMVIEKDRAFEDDDVNRVFSAVPRLFNVRDWILATQTAKSKKHLVETCYMMLANPPRANPLGKSEDELDGIYRRFANVTNTMLGEVFSIDMPTHAEGTQFPREERVRLAKMMTEVVVDTLQVVSAEEMSPLELANLRAEFTGTNVFQSPTVGAHINDNKHVKAEGLEAAGKKGALHTESGFKLEADGPYEEGRMDIEYVTSPFEETVTGLKELKSVMKRIRAISKNLGNYAGRDFNQGEFVRPNENQLSAGNVYLSGGRKEPSFQMQVTQGIPLRDLPTLMKYLGTNVDYEGPDDARERQHSRRMMGKEASSNRDSDAMGRAPQLAKELVNLLISQYHILSEDDDLPTIEGFFAYALLYIMQLDMVPFDGIKMRTTLMSRFSFDQLFGKLDETTQRALRENAGFVAKAMEGVLGGFLKGFQLDRPMMNITKMPREMVDMGHQGFFELLKRVTVRDWVDGVLAEGVDRLTSSGIKAFLESQGADTTPYAKSFDIFSRGHGDSRRLEGETDSLAVMENRGLNPLPLAMGNEQTNMAQTEELAIAYLQFMIQLRLAKGDPEAVGAFPKLKSIPAQKR